MTAFPVVTTPTGHAGSGLLDRLRQADRPVPAVAQGPAKLAVVMRRGPRVAAGAALALLLAACAGPQIEFASATPLNVAAKAPSAASCPADGSRDVLLLSSGGADGAFGAGLLEGWTRSGRRPAFDVVTGVSTGALQATAAFLGPSEDSLLRQVYTTSRTEDVLKSNGPLAALFGPGLYRLTPLRKRLRALIDAPMLERVAAEHRAGRRLYVGTTDLTRGHAVIWDMGAIAASPAPDRRERYIAVLLASSAVPGVIEPVVVRGADGEHALHGDGATKAPLLFEPSMIEGGCRTPTTVWTVANGHVSPEGATVIRTRRTLALARRGVSQLMRRFLYTTAVATAYRAREAGAAFQLMRLPDDVPEAKDPFEFRPDEMARLYETGVRLGLDAGAWGPAPGIPRRLARQ